MNIQHLFNLLSCFTCRDRLRVLQSIQLSACRISPPTSCPPGESPDWLSLRPSMEHILIVRAPGAEDHTGFPDRPFSLLGGGLVESPTARDFLTRPLLAHRDVPAAQARAFRFSTPLWKGVAEAALYCAHRTSTFLSCAFCEQEGHLAAPSIFPRPRVARARSSPGRPLSLDCPFHRLL